MLTSKDLIQHIKKLAYSDRTIRRKLNYLNDIGLIRLIKSSIIIIEPIQSIKNNIRKLCTLWNMRDRNIKQKEDIKKASYSKKKRWKARKKTHKRKNKIHHANSKNGRC